MTALDCTFISWTDFNDLCQPVLINIKFSSQKENKTLNLLLGFEEKQKGIVSMQ